MTAVNLHSSVKKHVPLQVLAERHALKLCFVISLAIIDVWGQKVQHFCDVRKWHLDQLYGSVFGFSAIEIGGLLALYTVLIGDTATSRRMGNTKSFQRYIAFVKTGIWVSGALAILSLPILVIDPGFTSPTSLTTMLASSWYALSLTMAVALFRVITIAPLLIEPDWNRPPH